MFHLKRKYSGKQCDAERHSNLSSGRHDAESRNWGDDLRDDWVWRFEAKLLQLSQTSRIRYFLSSQR